MADDDGFEPLIIAYCCYWCSYTAADLAGTSRLQYPPNVRIIRVQCSGMVHPNLVINALEAMPHGGTVAVKSHQQYVEKLIGGFDNISVGDYIVGYDAAQADDGDVEGVYSVGTDGTVTQTSYPGL